MLLLHALLLGAQASWGQEDDGSGIEQLVAEAEAVIEDPETSVPELLRVRARLDELRRSFAEIVDRGSVRARGLQAQLSALGSRPEDGAGEPAATAESRDELEQAFAAANAPIVRADGMLKRTDLLIREIDARIREKQARRVLLRTTSPLLPSSWAAAAHDLRQYGRMLREQVEVRLSTAESVARLRSSWPGAALALAAAAGLLLANKSLVMPRLRAAYSARTRRRARWSLVTAEHLLRFLLPCIAVACVVLAIERLDITPYSARMVPGGVMIGGLILVAANWLGHALFAPERPEIRMLALGEDASRQGVRVARGLGAALGLTLVLKIAAQDYPFSEATVSVVSLLVIALVSSLLWRLGSLLNEGRASGRRDAAPDGDSSGEHLDGGFLWFLAKLMQVTAAAAPLLMLMGFVGLANQAVMPMIGTIALLGFALLIFHTTMAVARAITERRRAGVPLLLPIGVIGLLAAVCIPLLSLTWGAQPTDIAEAWRLLSDGVTVGEVRLTFDAVIILLIVIVAGVLVTRWVQRVLRLSVMPRTRLDPGAQTAIVTGVGYLGFVVTGFAAVSAAGLDLSSLAVVLGALSVGIGFGLQTIVSNFVAGVILLVERPIKEGDWIEVSGFSGIVRKIAVRSTRVETFDRHDVIIPNQDLIAGTVKNMTLTTLTGRVIVPVGVAYGSDLGEVRRILAHAAEMHGQVLSYPEPQVLFIGLGDSSLDFELRCFLRDIGQILAVKSDLLLAIYSDLGKAGIEIPFPQRDVHVHGLKSVVGAGQPPVET